MKLLIIGSGGREHALAWKLAQSKRVKQIFVAPGNAGTYTEPKCLNVEISGNTQLLEFAKKEKINITIVGPEQPLANGIVDDFEAAGFRIFGPNKQAAQLEASKAYSKDFMQRHGMKTATYRNFNKFSEAWQYLQEIDYPTVVKASGLAAGKGVIICRNFKEAEDALKAIMQDEKFGSAGSEVVIEEYLEGWEASILSVCDGKTILPFISAKDHKKIGEGETGLNTGGMGVIAPNPLFTKTHWKAFERDILYPTLQGIQKDGLDFKGVIFFGLMITKKGVHCLEYNCRFGDPETQAVLPLLESDLLDIIEATIDQSLDVCHPVWSNDHSCCVVGVSDGYPGSYEKGKEITADTFVECKLFLAGAQIGGGKMITSGGRVLNVTATASTLQKARDMAYAGMEGLHFEGMYYRKDIGEL